MKPKHILTTLFQELEGKQKNSSASRSLQKEVVAKPKEASRFLAIYNEYKNAKQVTQERMYLETMEKVLADIDKIIIDKKSGSGVVPYLPLPELKRNRRHNNEENIYSPILVVLGVCITVLFCSTRRIKP